MNKVTWMESLDGKIRKDTAKRARDSFEAMKAKLATAMEWVNSEDAIFLGMDTAHVRILNILTEVERERGTVIETGKTAILESLQASRTAIIDAQEVPE